MSKIQRFEDLEIWQNAMEIAVEIYKISSTGKLSKDFGLKDQITRAVISISNNISEGYEYDNTKDFIKFLRYAKGSTREVRNILNLLTRIEFIEKSKYTALYNNLISLSKQIFGFMKYLENYNKNKNL